MSKVRAKTNFYLAILLLIAWILYSWIMGPSRSSIDAQYPKVESSIEHLYYVVEFIPRLMAQGVSYEEIGETPLEESHFSLNSERSEVIKQNLLDYYQPYLDTVRHMDTIKNLSQEMLRKNFQKMSAGLPVDTSMLNVEHHITNQPFALFQIVFKDVNSNNYFPLSLGSIPEVNLAFKGQAPNSYEKTMAVSNVLTKQLSNTVTLLIDKDSKRPSIYKIYNSAGEELVVDESISDEEPWYQRGYFLLICVSLIASILIAYFQSRR